MNVEQYGAGIFTVPGVLSRVECAQLISLSEGLGFEKTTMNDLVPGEALYRENDRVLLTDDQLAGLLYQRTESFLPEVIDGW